MGKFLIGLLAVLFLLILGSVVFERTYRYPKQVKFGVTFSPRYAEFLNLDWQKTYLQILDELQVKDLRIPGYWDILETKKTKYDFTQTDFMLDEAGKRGVKVVLVLGMRQPRWPECHIPVWARSLSVTERRHNILQFIQEVVDRYKNHPAVWAWQVENEPLLPFFGEGCDPINEDFLRTEVNLVKSLSEKTIIISDSGELGFWGTPMRISNIIGISLYRDVYNPVLGYLNYPILPYLYNIKSQVIRKAFAPQNQKTIITELQAEPWFKDGDLSQNFAEQARLFPLKKLESYINYAQKTGFDTMYLWGVEWWYLMAAKGHPEYLNYARTLFR